MFGIDDDPAATTATLPEIARLIGRRRFGSHRSADIQGQLDPEPEQGCPAIFSLRAPLGGLGGDPGWPVGQDDSRLNLVAVLASWTGTAGRATGAFRGQRIEIEPSGMEAGWVVRSPLLRDRVIRAHDVHRPENGKTTQSILAMFQNRSGSVVLGDGWHSTEAVLCPTLPCRGDTCP